MLNAEAMVVEFDLVPVWAPEAEDRVIDQGLVGGRFLIASVDNV